MKKVLNHQTKNDALFEKKSNKWEEVFRQLYALSPLETFAAKGAEFFR